MLSDRRGSHRDIVLGPRLLVGTRMHLIPSYWPLRHFSKTRTAGQTLMSRPMHTILEMMSLRGLSRSKASRQTRMHQSSVLLAPGTVLQNNDGRSNYSNAPRVNDTGDDAVERSLLVRGSVLASVCISIFCPLATGTPLQSKDIKLVCPIAPHVYDTGDGIVERPLLLGGCYTPVPSI